MSLPALSSRFLLLLFLLAALLGSCTAAEWQNTGRHLLDGLGQGEPIGAPLTSEDIAAGLKEALQVSSERVVARLGQAGGFNADPEVHIPLPEQLAPVRATLSKVGLGSLLDDLETRLNRAAETATPQARDLFWQAIKEMTLDDVMAIYRGPQDAATRYFEGKMSPQLAAAMRPVVDRSLDQVGAVRVYEQAMARYRALPFAPKVSTDLTGYVVDRAMDGIFHYLAVEEAAIRENPAKRTTDLLKRVFGGR